MKHRIMSGLVLVPLAIVLTTTPAYAIFGSILAGIQRAQMIVNQGVQIYNDAMEKITMNGQLTRIIHQRRKKRLTEPGFTTKDAVTGCWEVCAAEIGRWEVKNGVFGTQHSRRQLRNRVFGPSWAAKWGEVCPRRARRSLAQGMRS